MPLLLHFLQDKQASSPVGKTILMLNPDDFRKKGEVYADAEVRVKVEKYQEKVAESQTESASLLFNFY